VARRLTVGWATLIRLSIGFIFAFAALAKLRHPREAAEAGPAYQFLPRALTHLAAFLVLAAEAALSTSLIAGLSPTVALRSAAVLLILLAATSSLAMVRSSEPFNCGCLGSVVEIRENWTLVGGNVALAGLATAASFEPSTWSVGGSSSSPSVVISLLLAASLLALVYWVGSYAWSVRTQMNRILAERTVQ
jgi:Methylamine utilisation protein MauE